MSCKKRCFSLLSVVLGVALITVGCGMTQAGGAQSENAEKGEEERIGIIDFAGRGVTFSEAPERIVALGNGEVDIIYALGATLVGRPAVNVPHPVPAAEEVEVVGSAHTVDLEKIAMLRPDVVLGNDPLNLDDVPMLENIGAKVVLTHANSIEDILRQIELFGQILGKEDEAERWIAEIEAELDSRAASERELAAGADDPRVLLVYGAPGTYMAALPNSLAGDLLQQAGGLNVAAEFPSLQNFPQYAQLNAERVVQSDPDVILIMTHGNSEEVEQGFVREMEANPAWGSIRAVRNERIHVLPADLFGTNPGTRVIEALRWLEELLG